MRWVHRRNLLAGTIAVLWLIPSANADTVGFVKSPLVDHPVLHPVESRSAHRWRSSVGSWGENFAERTLHSRGFAEIQEIKAGGNQGIDRVAIKRGADGAIKDVRFVEVKTTRSSNPKLNRTKSSGTQMSSKYMADNLKKLRNSGDPVLKNLALEISRYRRSSGVPVQKLGEVIHINTKSGLATTFSGDLRSVQSVVSVERQLKQIQRRAGSAEVRRWAVRSLAAWDQIRSLSMTTYLGKDVALRSRNAILASATKSSTATFEAAALRRSRSALTNKILVRAAGPIATLVSLALDAKEFYDNETAYRNGAISQRQRNVGHLTKLAGTAGALAMAPVGAATGAWVGALGGPLAWITVPAGGFVGGTLFGVVGYFGGSTIAEYGSAAWYASIDASVRDEFERYWLATANPFD